MHSITRSVAALLFALTVGSNRGGLAAPVGGASGARRSEPVAGSVAPLGTAASPGATSTDGRATFLPLPARAAFPRPCPVPVPPPRPPGPPRPPRVPVVAEAAVPLPVVVGARSPDLAAVSGKGTWAVYFDGRRFDAAGLVRNAKAAGVDSIWIRTGGSRQAPYFGDDVLRQILLPAHRAGLKVIAWDFPFLSDPAVDAYRAKRALIFSVKGHRIDGFSPDIESSAEGVFPTTRRVAFYLSVVRAAAGDRPVITTLPRPTPKRLRTYPYAAVADGSDALAPMVYWSCLEPGKAVSNAMDALAPFGRPVHVIGQAYDMRSEGGRPGLPTSAETWRFVDVAHRRGAIGVSLYQIATAGSGQNKALAAYPWRNRG